ncbi:hypothetical protein HY989_00765 [Candidatus Micrarchaeota archaeon]|nr:hypothetical protein [Candidatus Micrarchaeota archaeon]
MEEFVEQLKKLGFKVTGTYADQKITKLKEGSDIANLTLVHENPNLNQRDIIAMKKKMIQLYSSLAVRLRDFDLIGPEFKPIPFRETPFSMLLTIKKGSEKNSKK